MTRLSQNTAMGIAIIFVCLMLMVRDRWFLAETSKGQRLVQRFGPDRALWVFRGVLLLLGVLGALLAADVVRPVKW